MLKCKSDEGTKQPNHDFDIKFQCECFPCIFKYVEITYIQKCKYKNYEVHLWKHLFIFMRVTRKNYIIFYYIVFFDNESTFWMLSTDDSTTGKKFFFVLK